MSDLIASTNLFAFLSSILSFLLSLLFLLLPLVFIWIMIKILYSIASGHPIARRKNVVFVEPPKREPRADRNRASVQGLDYALKHGVVTQSDLDRLEPSVLQAKVDRGNPISGHVHQTLQALEEYDTRTTLSPKDHRRQAILLEQLREMRETPEVLRLKAIAPKTDMTIIDNQEVLRVVQELPEG